jgi:hypothetical protein
MSEVDLATRWGISPKTLQRWRTNKSGPPYLKLSKRVKYLIEDVVAYEQQQRRMPQLIGRVCPDNQDDSIQDATAEPADIVPKRLFTLHEALARMARHGSIEDPAVLTTT